VKIRLVQNCASIYELLFMYVENGRYNYNAASLSTALITMATPFIRQSTFSFLAS